MSQIQALASGLIELLDVERIEENIFLGQNETRNPPRLFGGQVLSQALVAATRTVEGVVAHSLHAYFLTEGSVDRPVLYEVERIRDGRSFVTRRVVAVQQGKPIFSMDISFHIEEVGYDHAHPMPNVPLPEELKDDLDCAKALGDDPRIGMLARKPWPFEVRSVFQIGSKAWAQNRFHSPTWIRFPQTVSDQALARAILGFASDMSVVGTAALPHQSQIPRNQLQMASLDHALWIHRNVPMGEWLLFHKRTTLAEGSRGLIHGDFFTFDGELIASVSQEGLVRQVD